MPTNGPTNGPKPGTYSVTVGPVVANITDTPFPGPGPVNYCGAALDVVKPFCVPAVLFCAGVAVRCRSKSLRGLPETGLPFRIGVTHNIGIWKHVIPLRRLAGSYLTFNMST
jgi:hypothetical protein